MTMLAPGAKAELLERWMQAGLIDPESGQEMLAQHVSAELGRWDDPFLMEIKRSIAKWEEGMPEGYQPPVPQRSMIPGPMGPQMVVQVAPDPVALGVFPPKPHHALPLVAKRRMEQLARLMASTRFDAQPPQWQHVVAQEYERMQQAMMPAMVGQPGAPGQPGQPQPETQGAQTPNPNEPASPSNPTLDPQARAA
jgi:hypothetical protein